MARNTYIVSAVVLGIAIWLGTDFFLRKDALDTFKKSSYEITNLISKTTSKENQLLVSFQEYSKQTAELLKNKRLKTNDRENVLYNWDMVFEKIRNHIKDQANSFGEFALITTKKGYGDRPLHDHIRLAYYSNRTKELKNFSIITEKNLPGVTPTDIKGDISIENARMHISYMDRLGQKKYNSRFNEETAMFEYLADFVLSIEKNCALLTESTKEGEKSSAYFIDKFNDTCLEKSKETYDWLP